MNKASLRIEERCWELWARQLFTLYNPMTQEVYEERIICCQLERGHAHEHESDTIHGEISWDHQTQTRNS